MSVSLQGRFRYRLPMLPIVPVKMCAIRGVIDLGAAVYGYGIVHPSKAPICDRTFSKHFKLDGIELGTSTICQVTKFENNLYKIDGYGTTI